MTVPRALVPAETAVDCPFCHAAAGTPCVKLATRQPTDTFPHIVRMDAADGRHPDRIAESLAKARGGANSHRNNPRRPR